MRYRDYADMLRVSGAELYPKMAITFHMPMPASWSKKKCLKYDNSPHQQKPDIDNLVKAVLDALAEQDSFVWQIVAEKLWAPGGFVEIREIDGPSS